MKNYFVYMKIGYNKFKWYVFAKDSKEAIEKALKEVKFEMDHVDCEIKAIIVKEIKE